MDEKLSELEKRLTRMERRFWILVILVASTRQVSADAVKSLVGPIPAEVISAIVGAAP